MALSGDVWKNQILLNLVRRGLKQDGFVVYSHQQIPTNDGGLALVRLSLRIIPAERRNLLLRRQIAKDLTNKLVELLALKRKARLGYLTELFDLLVLI